MPEGKSNYPPAEVVHRRSERVLLDMPLVIRGEPEDKLTFREQTFTLTVSAHGALVLLATTVVSGQTVVLMNPKTWDERKGKITYLGSSHAGLAQVGIEFEQPAPDFWSISSPPADWNLC
ncbi:MAG: hypothetical protein DMG32_08055 [Acidobacteria bacterium]|nr:MAG: hypothetical protein DMG32_08055 [Acidobacteriota bacterium]